MKNKIKLNQPEKILDTMFGVTCEEYKNNPEIEDLIKEYIKDLPAELTKEEIKNLSEEDRKQRNELIISIKKEIKKKRENGDDFHNFMYCHIYNEGTTEERKELLQYKEGAYRAFALNKAITICNERLVLNKEEIKNIKNKQKESKRCLQEGFKQGLKDLQKSSI